MTITIKLNPETDLLVILKRYDSPTVSWGVHRVSLHTDRHALHFERHEAVLVDTEQVESFLLACHVEPASWSLQFEQDEQDAQDLPLSQVHRMADEALWDYIRYQLAPIEFQSDERWAQRRPFIETYQPLNPLEREVLINVDRLHECGLEIVEHFRETIGKRPVIDAELPPVTLIEGEVA